MAMAIQNAIRLIGFRSGRKLKKLITTNEAPKKEKEADTRVAKSKA